MVLNCSVEKTLESPLDCKEIQQVCYKGDQSWVFIGRTDVEAETLLLWPPDGKSWLIGKDPDAGKDWSQEEKETTGWDGWHHRLNVHGFGWTTGIGDGQGGLACYGSWSRKELDTTEWLNWPDHHSASYNYFVCPLSTVFKKITQDTQHFIINTLLEYFAQL